MKNLNKKTTTDGKSRSVEETLTVELAEVFGRISNRKASEKYFDRINGDS